MIELDESAREILLLREQLAEATRRADRAEALLSVRDPEGPANFLAVAAEELQRSEHAMRAVFTGATDALLLIDDEGRYVDANPAACALFGVPRGALLRRRVGDFTGDSKARAFEEMRARGAARGRATVTRPDGTRRFADFALSRNIRPGLHLSVLRDVTDETAAAEALARSSDELRRRDARFRAMVEKSAEAVALFSSDGKLTYATPHSEKLLGVAPELLVGENLYDWIHPEDHDEIARAVVRMSGSGTASVECRVVRRNGTVRWVAATLTNLIDDPDVAAIVVNLRDVTERRVAEAERERLIESLTFERRRLGAVLENAPSFTAVLRGKDHVFEFANKAYYDMVGNRELIGRPFAEAIPEFADQGIVALVDGVLRSGTPHVVRGRPAYVARAHGSVETRFVSVTVQALVEADGTRSGVFIHGIDVTDETLGQRRLRAQFNGIPVPTYAWQRVAGDDGALDFQLLDYNEAALRITQGKIEAFRGRGAREVFVSDPDVLSDLERCSETGETFSRELEQPMRSVGVTKRLLITYAPAPPDVVLAHTEDVTERHQLEEQLRQAQKMEAVGRLAGGVAHDFNNLLSVVLSYTLLMLDDLPPGHPLRPDLEEVKLAGDRAVELTRQLLAFSRQQVLQPRQMSLTDAVLGLERMLRRLLGEDVELVLRTNATAVIEADPGQVEQVLMNLVINARDAMPEGGVLTIETSDEELREARVGDPMSTPAGAYAVLSVSDTGTGMDAATRARIFEPFFTTKGPGKGTGLGLSTVFGIVQQSGATIQVDSAPGAGSTFRLHIPCAARVARASESLGVRRMHGGKETILVVEDEAPLRALAVTILRRAGYEVLSAADGEAAVALAESYERPIHLLLTDVVMPRVSGRELAERIAVTRPDVKTLFMSGYTDDAAVLRRILESRAAFLQKPLTPDTLLRKVREVLDAESPATTA